MAPIILTALKLAKDKADSQNQFAQNLNTNPFQQNQPQQNQINQPQQNKQNLFSLFSQIYGGFGK